MFHRIVQYTYLDEAKHSSYDPQLYVVWYPLEVIGILGQGLAFSNEGRRIAVRETCWNKRTRCCPEVARRAGRACIPALVKWFTQITDHARPPAHGLHVEDVPEVEHEARYQDG